MREARAKLNEAIEDLKKINQQSPDLKQWEKDYRDALKSFGDAWNKEMEGVRKEITKTATHTIEWAETEAPCCGDAMESGSERLRQCCR